MQRADRILIQNVIGRITHGLIGFDLSIQGKGKNQFLQDFLTLKNDELELALISASVKYKWLPAKRVMSPEEKSLIASVTKAQGIAKRIDQTPTNKIEQTMTELEERLDLLYQAVFSR